MKTKRPERTFTLSWNWFIWLTTIFTLALLCALAATFYWIGVLSADQPPAIRALFVTLIPAMLIFPAIVVLFAPLRYTVGPSEITVRRIGPNVRLRLDEVKTVETIRPKSIWNVLGCNGLFGNFGWFYTSDIGLFRAYLSRTGPAVLIRLKTKKPVAISPDDHEGCIAEIRANLENQ